MSNIIKSTIVYNSSSNPYSMCSFTGQVTDIPNNSLTIPGVITACIYKFKCIIQHISNINIRRNSITMIPNDNSELNCLILQDIHLIDSLIDFKIYHINVNSSVRRLNSTILITSNVNLIHVSAFSSSPSYNSNIYRTATSQERNNSIQITTN